MGVILAVIATFNNFYSESYRTKARNTSASEAAGFILHKDLRRAIILNISLFYYLIIKSNSKPWACKYKALTPGYSAAGLAATGRAGVVCRIEGFSLISSWLFSFGRLCLVKTGRVICSGVPRVTRELVP